MPDEDEPQTAPAEPSPPAPREPQVWPDPSDYETRSRDPEDTRFKVPNPDDTREK
jgi:hypothetical protein